MRRLVRLRYVAIALALALVAVAAAEWAARRQGFGQPPIAKRDPDIGYFLEPNRSYRRFGHLINLNRYGFRSVDVDVSSLSPQQHVLLIGDSVIYGNHYIDQSETVAARLQAAIRDRGDAGVVVSSMAVSSWSPVNQLAFYRRFGPFPSRQVWVVLSSHDLRDPIERSYDRIPYRTAAPMGALHDVAQGALERMRELLSRPPDSADDAFFHSTEPAIRDLVALLKLHHTQVGLCFHVTAHERGLDEVPEAQAILARIAHDLNVAMVVTTAAYREAERQGHAVYDDDIHLSAHGARTLAALLDRHGLAAPSGAPP